MPPSSRPHLNLWKQQLGVVPETVWERVELETLVLADNGLTSISDGLAKLKRLRMLDLGHNALASLPEAIGELDGLTDFLYPLDSLPESIADLPALDKLDLRWTPSLSLPEWTRRLEARGVLVYS